MSDHTPGPWKERVASGVPFTPPVLSAAEASWYRGWSIEPDDPSTFILDADGREVAEVFSQGEAFTSCEIATAMLASLRLAIEPRPLHELVLAANAARNFCQAVAQQIPRLSGAAGLVIEGLSRALASAGAQLSAPACSPPESFSKPTTPSAALTPPGGGVPAGLTVACNVQEHGYCRGGTQSGPCGCVCHAEPARWTWT
jgi:hypothetical protein